MDSVNDLSKLGSRSFPEHLDKNPASQHLDSVLIKLKAEKPSEPTQTNDLSTVLVLGIGEEDKGTELLHIGRTQFILWFPSEETGLVLNNIICVSA